MNCCELVGGVLGKSESIEPKSTGDKDDDGVDGAEDGERQRCKEVFSVKKFKKPNGR